MQKNFAKDYVRRSRLIMPAHVERFTSKAHLRNADVIVLDLEDSVPQDLKVVARQSIKKLISEVGKGGSDVFVRINNEAGKDQQLIADLDASIWPGLSGIYLPKAETAQEVKEIDRYISKLETERGITSGSVLLSICIESCLGYLNRREIVQASDRIDSLTLGTVDFLRDLGAVENKHTSLALLTPRFEIVVTAKAFNKIPLGLIGNLSNYQDEDAFEESAQIAYSMGFLGASCINPKNIETLNHCFSPSTEEIDKAIQIIQAFESALDQGLASITHQGRMIDQAHYSEAKALVSRAVLIEQHEEKKRIARQAIKED